MQYLVICLNFVFEDKIGCQMIISSIINFIFVIFKVFDRDNIQLYINTIQIYN